LVVSIPALLAAQAHINRNIAPDHQRFLACLSRDKDDEIIPEIRDFAEFSCSVLGWRKQDLEPIRPGDSHHAALEVTLPEYHETLRPTHVVREFTPKDPSHPWMMLVRVLPIGAKMDKVAAIDDRHWQATPHAKFERLLRETQVPIGMLVSDSQIRLVYAPRGESSGYATFNVAEMVQVAGRPIFAALHMLLSEERLFSLGEKQRLPAILADSRKYQNVVSTKLAEQVLAALFELVRGFQPANDQAKGDLLRDVLASDPNHVYHGLLTVLMRLVFILYAEDRGLLSNDRVYVNYYAVTGLFDRLRADAGRFPDTMDLRYGAWAQLLTLFRLIYEGGHHGGLHIPARQGYLFDPRRYPFLEGTNGGPHDIDVVRTTLPLPRVPDGVIFRVLNNLLILDGERLSYRTLDVEQIGSVYEAIMGFNLEVARGPSIAVKPKKAHGAPASINLEDLLAVKPADRPKWLKDQTDQALTGQALDSLKKSATIEDLLAALEKRIAREVTPNVVSKGAMVLQPSDERRRSGSHYTPRSLTESIVRTTLKPILDQFGERANPEQILGLKVCDPAMGSGAFLVEACRQLGDTLVKAWHLHDCVPKLPPDEDEVLHARRLIAQRCLYGVDKNPMAVDLSKLSLWLATLAKDHPFTFLDHSLRCGDSLVGLTRDQITAFHWHPKKQMEFLEGQIGKRIARATEYRRQILAARDDVPYEHLRQCLDLAEETLAAIRLSGDAVVAAFFAADKDRQREQKRGELAGYLESYLGRMKVEDREPIARAVSELRGGDRPIPAFHWHIEFPEVFSVNAEGRMVGGFDAIVGNPPFAGKNTLINSNRDGYVDWLKTIHEESHGSADLVAHFFRRAFHLLKSGGCFGLIATNTIGQGDTRSTGLRWICTHGGTIYNARKRYKWPGQAAVVVSVVHVGRNGPLVGWAEPQRGEAHRVRRATPVGLTTSPTSFGPPYLDGRAVPQITAYLFHAGSHNDPQPLRANAGKSFQGSIVLGMGFTFDDTDTKGVANPVALMHELVEKNPRNSERIFPYIGGEEVNDSPTHAHRRYVINFGEMTEEEARRWPDLMQIVEEKVKGTRASHSTANWWHFERLRGELYEAIRGLERVLVISRVSSSCAFAFLPTGTVYSELIVIFIYDHYIAFACLNSRLHEIWASFYSTTHEERFAYMPERCFETFPFPQNFESNPTLETAGQAYYEFRAALMVKNNEGLTKTYNRFHDPDELSPDILKLRELHDAMDRAVLDAYGWTDLKPTCEFLLDYEDEDDENEEETGSTGRTRKKPWRYRWPDEFRDEVLARLLDLNQKRAELERLSGAAAEAGGGKSRMKSTGAKKAAKKNADQPELFGG
jgi:hypothetical protein